MQLAPRKVLVAEDDADIRELIRLTLAGERLEVIEARDGDAALHLAREHRPDLVFLDWVMPGRSGVEVCRLLREDPRTDGMRIVLLSGRGEPEDRDAGYDAGCDEYMTKPFSPIRLLDKVREVLGPEALM